MLSVSSISYSIGNKQVLKNISAGFPAGQFNMILGQNGSGKSSFLRVFSGEINHYSGTVLYDNKKLSTIRTEQLAKVRAVMSQQPVLSFPLTVEEVVMMGRYPHFHFRPGKTDLAICDEVISRMSLADFRSRNYLTLSGGEKQRVHFARVLAQVWPDKNATNAGATRYLFLDEPLTSLDIAYQQEFLQLAKEFNASGNTVLITVIHDINLASQYGDNLFFLKDGELVASGKPKEILSEELIEKVFGVKTSVINNPVDGSPLVIYR